MAARENLMFFQTDIRANIPVILRDRLATETPYLTIRLRARDFYRVTVDGGDEGEERMNQLSRTEIESE